MFDLMFVNSLILRFMSKSSHLHLGAGKKSAKIRHGTIEYSIMFEKHSAIKLKGYCNSGWAESVADMMSTLGYGVFSWN